MPIELVPIVEADRIAVTAFMTAHAWPFHVEVHPAVESVHRLLDSGWLNVAGTETFWVRTDGVQCGLLRIFDLDDGTPLFDLRLAERWRGQGIDTVVVRWLTGHVFDTYPGIDRIEATTRVDNAAMRRALRAAGWSKESHWRQSWPGVDDRRYDAVGYGVLRGDHVLGRTGSGRTTVVNWDDDT